MAAINSSKKRTGSLPWAALSRQSAFYIALLVLWYWYAHSGLIVSYAFADPLDVGHTLVDGFRSGTFEIAILVTMRRLIIGYVISLIIGLLLGLLIGRNRYAKETLGSLILGLQALPSVCWVPFALLWFGLSENAMTFVVVMGALFSITLGVEAGVKTTPPLYLKAARNMGARGVDLIIRVILPAALPSILSGLKQGWTFAWRSLMAAELIYITAQSLGGQLDMGRELSDYAQLIAVMLIIIAIGILTELIIFAPFERRVRERWGFS
ncbi:MAG TPA: ABC transporter permease [Ktedonobacteraceae bacterium]|jgi:NitT/TauT family transport system permease protein